MYRLILSIMKQNKEAILNEDCEGNMMQILKDRYALCSPITLRDPVKRQE